MTAFTAGTAEASGVDVVLEREYPLSGASSVRVSVASAPGGDQVVTVSTSHPGRLLLHWGVEGGAGYKGGWRLPRPRPEGTVEYKKRALQTPLAAAGAVQSVRIALPGAEASDFLNFVLKDVSTGTWYDCNGSNFHVALRRELAGGSMDADDGDAMPDAAAAPALLPLDQVPALPQELCGIWAYIKWEAAGSPGRSQEEADSEYQAAIAELTTLLRRGVGLDELWHVARGGVKYADFMRQYSAVLGGASAATREAPRPPPRW